MNLQRIGVVGYGEVGKTFAEALKPQAEVVSAWDLKFADPATRDAELAHAAQHGIHACDSMRALCEASDLVISAVTASNALAVAQEAARWLQTGAFFLDLNSASPRTKSSSAELVQARGAHYVEAGVMSSVPPYGLRVPMLLSGPQAGELAPLLTRWGMNAQVVSDEIGVASAIKMCRSVMIKGLEALVIESYCAARVYGVEDHVLATLQETFPSIDWSEQGTYFFSRVVQHGNRRAEEMRESAHTVHEAGFEPLMTSAIAAKQQWVADLAAAGVFKDVPQGARWQDYADRLLAARKP